MAGKHKGEFNTGGTPGANLYKDGGGYAEELTRTSQTMSDKAKLRRRLFVAHYIKTTNATSSATFAGFQSPTIKGAKLLREPYVQILIQDMLQEIDKDAIMTQNQILFQLKSEALNTQAANQGARISALAHMAKIRGMLNDDRGGPGGIAGGIMMVPVLTSADDWGKVALQAQTNLKESMKE